MKAEKEDLQEKWWNHLTDDEFQEVFRMSRKTVVELQAEIDHSEDIIDDRVDNVLLACLWILGNKKPFPIVATLFKIIEVEKTVENYLLKIVKLGSLYILWPTRSESKYIEKGFATEYGFPGVIGVIGSLHLEVHVDRDDAELYYNNIMGKHTVVLQVVCDNNYLLRDVCIGCPGGMTIKEILETSPLFSRLNSDDNEMIEDGQHLLGGTEHLQSCNLLTPYRHSPGKELTQQEFKFNALHIRVVSAVESTFRCLENRFPRLTSVDNLEPELASLMASSICILHNFTRIRNDCCEFYT